MRISHLNGFEVITADAFHLGEVEGAEVDIGTWQITYLIVELTKEAAKELGFKKPMFGSLSVCLPVTAVSKIGDVVTLGQSLIEFKNLRECKAD